MEKITISVRNVDPNVWAQFKAWCALNRKSLSIGLEDAIRQAVKEGEWWTLTTKAIVDFATKANKEHTAKLKRNGSQIGSNLSLYAGNTPKPRRENDENPNRNRKEHRLFYPARGGYYPVHVPVTTPTAKARGLFRFSKITMGNCAYLSKLTIPSK